MHNLKKHNITRQATLKLVEAYFLVLDKSPTNAPILAIVRADWVSGTSVSI